LAVGAFMLYKPLSLVVTEYVMFHAKVVGTDDTVAAAWANCPRSR